MARIRCAPPRIATADTRRVLPPPKRADAELLTPEHRAWREAVLQRAGHRCQDPQHDPQRPRSGVRLYADHIVERRDGGALTDLANGVARCASCHGRKTAAERARRMARRS